MEQWEKNYYISSIAGATNGSSLVVMSKGIYLFPAFIKTFICFLREWYFNYGCLLITMAMFCFKFGFLKVRSIHSSLTK